MKICNCLLVAIMATVIFMSSCKSRNESVADIVVDSIRMNSNSTPNSDTAIKVLDKALVSSKAAEGKANDSIIRIAELKFKVKQVYAATTVIEDIATHFGGFVSSSNLTSSIDQANTTEISADSSLETTMFTVTNNMVLRVPNTALDTALKSMAFLIDYLDYRNIKAEDSRLQFLQTQLTRNRLHHYNHRVEINIDTKGRKLTETTDAEDNLLSKQEQSDNALLENYSLKDKVNFSTITLTIYQRQGIKREVIANTKNIEPYKPSLIKRLAESLQTGWIAMENILMFFVSIWGIILLAFIVFFVYRKYFRNTKV